MTHSLLRINNHHTKGLKYMQSTIYLNNREVHGRRGVEGVDINFTSSPSELAFRTSALGYAFGSTLDTLGIDQTHIPGADLLVIGSAEEIPSRLKALRINIGSIATKASELDGSRGNTRSIIADTIDSIAQKLPAITESDPRLMTAVRHIVLPFGEETNDDGCRIEIGRNRTIHPNLEPGEYFSRSENIDYFTKPYRTAIFNLSYGEVEDLRTLANYEKTTISTVFKHALDQYRQAHLDDPEFTRWLEDSKPGEPTQS